MKIILDFDCTIFNTDKFREKVVEAFARHGVSRDLFYSTLEESRGSGRDWKPEIQFGVLRKQGFGNVDKIQNEFNDILESTHLFLYDDTLPFLKRAKKMYPLYILSYGEDWFQNKKIEKVSISPYFEKIIVTKNIYKDKEANDLSCGEPSIFVEDNPSALSAAKKYAPHIITVRINRGDGRYKDEATPKGVDYEVKDLKGVEEIIRKI